MLSTAAGNIRPKPNHYLASFFGPDRLVVRKLRCGGSSLGSNPGLDRELLAKEINGRGSTQAYHKKQLTLLKSMKK